LGTPLTPIVYATQKGYQDIVGLLVERGVKQIPQEQTLQLKFIEAARRRNTDELKNLLSQGAQINGKNPAEETALLSAIEPFSGSSNDYLAVVFLLDKGADLNLIGKGRTWVTTPLHDLVWIASLLEGKEDSRWANSEKLLRYFLKGGAFVSGSDEREKTPLHIAAERNGVKTAKILLTSGAKVMPRDKSKKTPLDYAQSAEMIALPKEYGAKEQ
jgi:ankyrin repeat protein